MLYTPGMDVPGEPSAKVELTDEVPAGALDTNADGSVNAYDAVGNVVGTVSADAVEGLLKEVGEVLEEQDKPKRGRKPKEV